MWPRVLLLTLALTWSGCTAPATPTGSIQREAQVCLQKAESWLQTPSDKSRLKAALQAAKEANASHKNEASPEGRVLSGDLDLLEGALNMAQLQVNQGKDAAEPYDLGESTPLNAVTVASGQLRTDLGRLNEKGNP